MDDITKKTFFFELERELFKKITIDLSFGGDIEASVTIYSDSGILVEQYYQRVYSVFSITEVCYGLELVDNRGVSHFV